VTVRRWPGSRSARAQRVALLAGRPQRLPAPRRHHGNHGRPCLRPASRRKDYGEACVTAIWTHVLRGNSTGSAAVPLSCEVTIRERTDVSRKRIASVLTGTDSVLIVAHHGKGIHDALHIWAGVAVA
jgi:hypothetical protein